MKTRLIPLLLVPLALAACDEQSLSDFRLPWEKEPVVATPEEMAAQAKAAPAPAVSPLQVPIEVTGGSPKLAPNADPKTMNVAAFTAAGATPYNWTAQVSANSVTFTGPDAPNGSATAVRRLVYTKGVEYVGERGGRVFTINIQPTACQDAAGQKFPMTVTGTVRGQRIAGCASPAETAGASATAPAPKPAG